jgi:ubiquitin-like protein Pup
MPTRTQLPAETTTSGGGTDTIVEEPEVIVRDPEVEKVLDETDDILDYIDSVLEEHASLNFLQKGGE